MSGWPIVLPVRLAGGKLQMSAQRLADALRGRKDGELRLILERVTATRSLQANKFYWGVIVETLSEHTGYEPDEMHEILKSKFLPKKLAVADGNGEIVGEFVIGGSTTKLDKAAFADYLRKIQQWAAEDLGVVIPDAEAA